jgi:hypothetical protein
MPLDLSLGQKNAFHSGRHFVAGHLNFLIGQRRSISLKISSAQRSTSAIVLIVAGTRRTTFVMHQLPSGPPSASSG